MDLTRTPGPVGDPFLDEVHRRLPDVDIVVLPEDAGARRGPVAVVDEAAARVLTERTGAEAARLWGAMAGDRAGDRDGDGAADGAAPWARLTRRGPGVRVATAQAVVRGAGDGPAMLARLRDALAGWAVRHVPGPVDRLLAERGGATVTASHAPATGVVVLEVASPPVVVGPTVDAAGDGA
jgi:hypothetical protein